MTQFMYQSDMFGDLDRESKHILKQILQSKKSGLTVKEICSCCGMSFANVDSCIKLLLYQNIVRVCGSRKKTPSSKKSDDIYVSVDYIDNEVYNTGDKMESCVSVIEKQYDPPCRSVCESCGEPVVLIKCSDGIAVCDPQRRFVVFGSSDNGVDLVPGFEDNGKFVYGRFASLIERDHLRARGSCGMPWTIMRLPHHVTCKLKK